MLKLKFQYFGYLMWRTDSLEKTLMLEKLKVGGEGDNRGWDSWMASLTWYTWVWAISWSRWWTGKPGVLQSMGSQRVGHDWARKLNWVAFVHGIFQVRIQERVAISSSRGSTWPRNRTLVSCISCLGRHFLYHCTTLEVQRRKSIKLKE